MDALVIPPQAGAVQPPLTFASAKPLLDTVPPPCALIVECPHREIGGTNTNNGAVVPVWPLLLYTLHCML